MSPCGDAVALTFFTVVSAGMAFPFSAAAVGLRVFSSGLRNAAQCGGSGFMRIVRKGDVGQRDDTDQAFVPVDDGEAPDLDVGHVRRNLVELMILETVANVGAHHVAD